MKTSGLFSVHQFKIQCSYNKPVRLIFFGDVHRDSPDHAHTKWQEFLDYARKQKDAYFFGMGDYLDSTSTSERECLGNISHRMHETFRNDVQALQLAKVELMAKELSFMRGRIIGMLNGNHYFEFSSGINSDQKLCELLGAKYLGVCSFTRLSFDIGGRVHSRDIFAHHGAGAARLVGGSLNRVQQMAEGAEADIYCVSDDTEILTENGWKKRNQIAVGERAAAFNIASEDLEWSDVLEKVEFDYSGNAVRLKNSNIDCLMHPKHRVIYKYDNGWLFTEAENLLKMAGQIKIPLAAKKTYTTGVSLSDSIIALCGWIVSEGSFLPSGIRITQKHKNKCDIIRSLLNESSLQFTENHRSDGVTVFYIKEKSCKELRRLLANSKDIPNWLYACDGRQFKAFLDALICGDGSKTGKNSATIYQARESFIDDLQGVCSAHGFRTSKSFKKGGFKNGGWVLCVNNKSTVDLALSRNLATIEKYDGKMWCITTQHGTFIARRNGKVFVTGNCMGHDHKKGALPSQPRLFLAHSSRDGLKVEQREPMLVRSGSFLASFRNGQVNYNVDACRPPSSLGHVELLITVKANKIGKHSYNPAEIEMRSLV